MIGTSLLVLLAAGHCPEPTSPEARAEAYRTYVAGQVGANEGRFADALEPLRQAARADPLLPQARYALGQALMGLRRFPEAVEAFTECREVFRCLAGLTVEQRAEVAQEVDRQIGELQDAIRSLERGDLVSASIPWPELNGPPRTRGETLRILQQLEGRLSQLHEWRRRGRDAGAPALVSLALGTALFQTGALDDAERELRKALDADPRNGDAHHNLAVVYLAMGRIPEAQREVDKAERAGVEVHPRLREAIRKRSGAPPR